MQRMVDDFSSALALRLRDLARMADRLDWLESGTGEWLIAEAMEWECVETVDEAIKTSTA